MKRLVPSLLVAVALPVVAACGACQTATSGKIEDVERELAQTFTVAEFIPCNDCPT